MESSNNPFDFGFSGGDKDDQDPEMANANLHSQRGVLSMIPAQPARSLSIAKAEDKGDVPDDEHESDEDEKEDGKADD